MSFLEKENIESCHLSEPKQYYSVLDDNQIFIKINRESDITFVTAAVTDFADSLGYCEYKIPLSIHCLYYFRMYIQVKSV